MINTISTHSTQSFTLHQAWRETVLKVTLLGSRYLTFVEAIASVRCNKAHTLYPSVTRNSWCLTGRLQSAVSGQAEVADNRKPWKLAVITDTGPQTTAFTPPGCSHRRGVLRSVMEGNTVFTQGKPVCPVCAFPSLASSRPFVLRLSGQVLHVCIYVVLL